MASKRLAWAGLSCDPSQRLGLTHTCRSSANFSGTLTGLISGWVAVPLVRSALMVGAALFLGTAALRRIWSSGGSPVEPNQEEPSTDLDAQDGAGEETEPSPETSAQRIGGRRLSEALVDQILTYSMEHPAEGPRTIAAAMALPVYGAWTVSASAIYGVLKRNGLNRRSDRLAAVG